MPPASVIILQYVCPGLGAVLSNLMCLSPVKDVHLAVKQETLGDMNPTPWIFMFGQSLGWVAYGIVHQDLWLFFSDSLGLIIGFWLNLSAIKLLYKEGHSNQNKKQIPIFTGGGDEESPVFNKSLLKGNLNDQGEVNETKKTRRTVPAFYEVLEEDSDDEEDVNITQRTIPVYEDEEEGVLTMKKRESNTKNQKSKIRQSLSCHESKFILVATLWFIGISIVNLVPSITKEGREMTVAMMASFNLVLFYSAPLSTISKVWRERDSSSIHALTMIANTVNASFWAAYGYAISEWSIIIPNGLGCFFGFIQIILCTFIPRKSKVSPPEMKITKSKIPLRSKCDDNITFPVQFQ